MSTKLIIAIYQSLVTPLNIIFNTSLSRLCDTRLEEMCHCYSHILRVKAISRDPQTIDQHQYQIALTKS